MRRVWLCLPLLLTGCGYVGDPLPPALHIPEAVNDLSVQQRGAKLDIRFTLPQLTTEGMGLEYPAEIELRIGPPAAGEFDANRWASGARRVPVPVPDTGTSAFVVAPLTEAAGTEVFVAVRTLGPSQRWSQWSNFVAFPAQRPLNKPQVQADSAPEGVQLKWTGDAALYRLARQAEGEPEMQPLAEVPTPAYYDKTAEFDKPYRYQVTAVAKADTRETISDPSDVVSITPADRFPPAVPGGLTALAGINTVELAWERNTEPDLQGYVVYRAAGDGQMERLGPSEPPSYSDKAVESGRTYRYAISSIDRYGNESKPSEAVSIGLP
ncbi:MAG: hypothetical protein JNK87_32925 [Bryobacterales bacterium]|nr:hypothetical protein [Bryobacterales bacterium]